MSETIKVKHMDDLTEYFNPETNSYDIPGGIEFDGDIDFGTKCLTPPVQKPLNK